MTMEDLRVDRSSTSNGAIRAPRGLRTGVAR
jgi:hypothetical protein